MRRATMTTPDAPVSAIPRLAVSVRELAESVGVSERTMAGRVADGDAPPSFLFGRLRLFPVAAVQTWLIDKTRDATAANDDAAAVDAADGEQTKTGTT
jgi:predicted DNA-binding transcriptional regulator AlpA